MSTIASDSHAEALGRLPSKELRELAKRYGIPLLGLRRKSEIVSALLGGPYRDEILRGLEARSAVSQGTQERLAATRDAIREAANMGAAVGASEDAWKEATEALDRGDLPEAEAHLARSAQLVTEARERRIREVEGSLSSVDDHIVLARKIGANVDEVERIRSEAEAAFGAREYALAGELIARAERSAMQAQLRQIERAIQIRQDQTARASALVAACEPVLQEAESYGLSVSEVRTLLRQARDVLARGDYVAGLAFARNAEEAATRLDAQLDEERRRRGIPQPVQGACGVCHSEHLTFYDDGWGRCGDCGAEFRWRGPLGIRERLRELLGT